MKLLVCAFAVLVGTALIGNPLSAQPLPRSDHYLSYRIEPRPLGATVFVEDQFLTQTPIQVLELERFLNPVLQDGQAGVDSLAHLDWWHVTPNPDVNRRINVINKFQSAPWDVTTLEFLLAPSRKNQPTPGIPLPDNINHFLCYRAIGPSPDRAVFLEDQFRAFNTIVREGVFFCNPCQKRHDPQVYPIVDPEVHLAVYLVDPPTFTGGVSLRDQFGEFQTPINSIPPEFLFVPSRKEIPTPVEPSTWGGIKSIYR